MVGAALAVGGLGLILLLRSTMMDNIDTALALRATDIAALLEDATPVLSPAIEDEEDGFVQILDDAGRVVGASRNVAGEGPLIAPDPGRFRTFTQTPLDEGPFRVHALRTSTADPMTILVGTSVQDVNRTVSIVTAVLAGGLPVLLIIVTTTTWFVVGRALRPVERIRSDVASITATDLHRRVPVPRTKDEVGRLATTMNHMLERLETASERQRRFVADASHELRSPIAVIRHELEVALQTDGDNDWRRVADDVLQEDLRMQRLIEDLLWLARQDASQRLAGDALVDLDDLVLAEVLSRARMVGHHPTIDTAQVSAGQVRGNTDDLRRTIRNLLENALRHARSRVAIALSTQGGIVTLAVADDGPGVPEERRGRIFERFERGDSARARDEGGAGLGLAIVAEIVRNHGGVVTVADSPGLGGAQFSIHLPDARAD